MGCTAAMATRVLSIDLGIINFSFCITDFREGDFDVVHLEKVAIGTMNQTAFQLTTALIDFLRSCQSINEAPIHNIYIEQQMSRAVKNTVLAYATASYFYTESKIAGGDVNIQFVPPRMKFNAIETYFPGAIESQDIYRSKSKELKRLSVKIARSVFTELHVSKGLDAMAKYSPKLDDIADAFLQSFAVFLDK
ncbi:unnamed protein product, partial [Ectocarpus sp. 6 AP-2014]